MSLLPAKEYYAGSSPVTASPSSSNGKTSDFGSDYEGSNPSLGAIPRWCNWQHVAL